MQEIKLALFLSFHVLNTSYTGLIVKPFASIIASYTRGLTCPLKVKSRVTICGIIKLEF